MKTKMCCKCKVYKSVNHFNKASARKDGLQTACKECHAELKKAKGKLYDRERKLKFKYGVDLNDYERLLEEQEGCCAICGVTPENEPYGVLSVDHNHDTGEVRGLLCNACNRVLGFAKDSKQVLKKAYAYLDKRGSYGA